MEIKKKYKAPLVDLVELEEKDIIITSANVQENWDLKNDNDIDKF